MVGKPGKHQITGIPFPAKDPRYHRTWELIKRKGKTLEEALAIVGSPEPGGGTPPPEKKPEKKKTLRKGPSGNGKVKAADLLGNDKVLEEVKDKIRAAQGDEKKHANNMLPDGDCNKSQSITIPLTGTLDLSRLIEAIRKEQPDAVTNSNRMEVLVVPQEDGQAVWDITNDLATMNLHLKRNNELLVQIERHLAALAEALEKK